MLVRPTVGWSHETWKAAPEPGTAWEPGPAPSGQLAAEMESEAWRHGAGRMGPLPYQSPGRKNAELSRFKKKTMSRLLTTQTTGLGTGSHREALCSQEGDLPSEGQVFLRKSLCLSISLHVRGGVRKGNRHGALLQESCLVLSDPPDIFIWPKVF